MDAKTASNDFASHPKHDYEQVFPAFAPPPPAPPSDANENGAPESNAGEPRKAGGGRSTLFWVNSDPQSVRGGSREATLKRIRSHVMSEHNRKKRLENTRRYNKSKSWKNLAFRPEPGASSRSSPTTSEGSSAKDTPSPEHGDDLSPHLSPVKSERESPATEVVLVHSPSGIIKDLQAGQVQEWEAATNGTGLMADPWSFVGQGLNDPFNTTHVQLSDRQYGHVEFFLFDLVARAVPFKTHIIPKLRKHWTSLVQEHSAPLHACITSAATNKALISGDFFADPITQRTSPHILDRLHHRGETIKLVNLGLSNLATASSDALIAAVSILISIEIVGANADYIAIHLSGLRKMVSLRKHFSDIAPDVRSQIEWTDIRAACLNLSKPIFPFIRYARPPSMPSLVSPENGGKLASRLRALARIPAFFGEELCSTIDDLLELSLYAEIARLQPQRAALLFDDQVEEYFNNEVLWVEYCIFRDRYTWNGLRGDDTIEGGVRLACLIFHNTAIWGFFPEMAAVLPQPVLALESSIRSGLAAGLYRHHPDLLIWLLFIGACSAKFLRQRLFFMSELGTVVTAHGLQTFDEFHSLLGDFFYVDRCYLSECRDIWTHIHSTMLSPHQNTVV